MGMLFNIFEVHFCYLLNMGNYTIWGNRQGMDLRDKLTWVQILPATHRAGVFESSYISQYCLGESNGLH